MTSILFFPAQPSSSPDRIAASYRSLMAARTIHQRVPFVHTNIPGACTFGLWIARWRERSMLRNELLLQPDSVLEDANYRRKDAVNEAAKPFWVA